MSDALVFLHGSANDSWGPVLGGLGTSGGGEGQLARTPHASLTVVPGAAHMIPLTHAAHVVRALGSEATS